MTTKITPEKLAELRGLLEKFKTIHDRVIYTICNTFRNGVVYQEGRISAEDFAALCTAINALPALLDRAEDAEHYRIRALTAKARLQSSIKILANITGFLKPENIKAPDGQVYEFNPSDEIVRAHWDGLTKAIRQALSTTAAGEETR